MQKYFQARWKCCVFVCAGLTLEQRPLVSTSSQELTEDQWSLLVRPTPRRSLSSLHALVASVDEEANMQDSKTFSVHVVATSST